MEDLIAWGFSDWVEVCRICFTLEEGVQEYGILFKKPNLVTLLLFYQYKLETGNSVTIYLNE